MRFPRLWAVTSLISMLLLTACNALPTGPRTADPTGSVSEAHLPSESAVGPWRLPAQLAWLDEQTLVYTSSSGIELLAAAGGTPQTLGGLFRTVAAAPDTNRIAFWGDQGVGIATREPLAVSRLLWPTAEMTAWAREQAGEGALFVVEEIHWSPDSREIGLLVRARSVDGAELRSASALVTIDVNQGKRTMVMTRTGREGSIRTFRWDGPLLIQYQTTPDHEGAGTRADTTDLIIVWDKDVKTSKPMATLPYPLTLTAVSGQTALFNPTHQEYSEKFVFQPYTGRLQVGMKPDPVGEAGQTGLLSPRDGQLVLLKADQKGGVIAPSGDRIAVPVANGKGHYSIRIDVLPAPPSAAIEVNRALPIEATLVPAPTGNGTPPDITDVAFRTERKGFAVTWHGAIYETGDGGATWHSIYQGAATSLQQIRFAPDGTAFVVGGREGAEDPLLLISRNDGRTWTEVMAHGLHLFNLVFADAIHGYAVKDPSQWHLEEALRNIVLATSDGGRSWEPRPLPEGAFPTGGIAFTDSLTGFVTASTPKGPAILYTSDGGQTWQTRYTGDVTLYALQFLDAQTGFAGGGVHYKAEAPPRQFLLRTDDGGQTWQEVYRGDREGGNISRLQFLDRSTGWAATGIGSMGQSGPIAHGLAFTSDGGRTWRYAGSTAGGWSALGLRLWYVAGAPDRWQSFIRLTEDGGAHWQTLAHPSAVAVERLALVDPKSGWLQTNFGLYRTTDGAGSLKSYAMNDPVGDMGWQAFLTPRDVVAVSGNELLRSRDGGQTWQKAAMPEQMYVSMNAMAFADPETGWVYENDKLYATRDGGKTWERLTPGLNGYVQAMAFGDANHGVAAANKSLVTTADGGRTWSGVPLGNLSLRSASYTKDGHIWLSGGLSDGNMGREEGAMLHSPDWGKTWQVYRSGEIHPQAVTFADKGHGWMVAWAGNRSGVLLVTDDGGGTWKQLWPAVD